MKPVENEDRKAHCNDETMGFGFISLERLRGMISQSCNLPRIR